MSINICVLRSGGEYNESHVHRLAKQVPDLVCLSDINIKGVETIKLNNNFKGWWSKLELFRPSIKEDLFYFDLDTLVLKMPAIPDKTTVLTDFGDKNVIASGLMFIKHEDKAVIWDNFIKDPQKAMDEHIKWKPSSPVGDGGFINRYYKHCQRWQNIAKVYSYKFHCLNGLPKDAEIVCFHGKPRPFDLNLDWMPK